MPTGRAAAGDAFAGAPPDIVAAFCAAGVGFVGLDENHDIQFINDAFVAAVSPEVREARSFVGRSFATEFPELPSPSIDAQDATAAARSRRAPIVWSRAAGRDYIGLIAATPAGLEWPATLFAVDDLTGLGTRKYLKASFENFPAVSSGRAEGVAALFLDLDHFKQVNDTLGHAVGDGLLARVAARLKKSVRRDDVIARVGGDEFAILLSGRSTAAVEEVAARIVKMIGRPFLVDGHQLTIGVSIGMAVGRPGEQDPEGVLQRADIALYESKRRGRNQFNWFRDDMLEELARRRDLEIDLRKAVLLDQFEVAFQPQMGFQQQRISGFEALIRWHHPQRGELPPSEFIGIAEETGLIIGIGTWVLNEACRAAVTWPADLSVAVNVSSIQFEDADFIDLVRSALAVSGLDPRRLELEITETALLTNDEMVLARMTALRAMGVKISLDDFGIGYSSLNYLRKFPFDKVKIDQSFVREPFADANAAHIVEAVAQLGIAFGMDVLAEGVETREQLERIRANGCGSIQGFLIGRPIRLSEIDAFLATPLLPDGDAIPPFPDKETRHDET